MLQNNPLTKFIHRSRSFLTLSWLTPLSYRNQSIDLLCKSPASVTKELTILKALLEFIEVSIDCHFFWSLYVHICRFWKKENNVQSFNYASLDATLSYKDDEFFVSWRKFVWQVIFLVAELSKTVNFQIMISLSAHWCFQSRNLEGYVLSHKLCSHVSLEMVLFMPVRVKNKWACVLF